MKKIIYAMCAMGLGLLVTGCGELFPLDTDQPDNAQIKIDRTGIDIMVGETYTFNVVQAPQDARDKAVAWTSENTDIVRFEGDKMKAVATGTTSVTVEWLSEKLKASCMVNVIPQWKANPYIYPYDMMIYANVKVGGRPIDNDCIVAAFGLDNNGNEEIRGVGELLTEHGVTYLSLRVFSPTASGYDILLRCYDRKRMLVVEIPEDEAPLSFNDYGYGSLSSLCNIEFE